MILYTLESWDWRQKARLPKTWPNLTGALGAESILPMYHFTENGEGGFQGFIVGINISILWTPKVGYDFSFLLWFDFAWCRAGNFKPKAEGFFGHRWFLCMSNSVVSTYVAVVCCSKTRKIKSPPIVFLRTKWYIFYFDHLNWWES